MKFLFLGDISIAEPVCIESDYATPNVFNEVDVVFANLEGPIVSGSEFSKQGGGRHALYNSGDVFDVLATFQVKAVGLANNHIDDLLPSIEKTRQRLTDRGISAFGAGPDLSEAGQPFVASSFNTVIKAFGFGWDVIGCRSAGSSSEGVNPLTPGCLFRTIRELRSVDKSSFVVFIMHWNYELELYPQPAQRQLAHDLIREGVDAVIGLHPHVAQGAELIEGKPLVYSLGNWFFPVRRLGRLLLKYPPVSTRELALEIEVQGRQVQDVRFHWYQFDPELGAIAFKNTEGWGGFVISQLTPYAGMNHQEYVPWFRANRKRRRGLPVYKDYHDVRRNWIRDKYVRLRQLGITTLVRLRLKGGPGT
jgi:poly-gamma-glutamate synthesis protein (capsule biosynthesis protein)